LDAGVVFSGAGWRGQARRCLLAMAHRRVIACATEETLKELSNLLADRGDRAKHPLAATLSWYQDHVKRVEPAPLGKQRSRDLKDDPYLACALGAGAKIMSHGMAICWRWESPLESKSLRRTSCWFYYQGRFEGTGLSAPSCCPRLSHFGRHAVRPSGSLKVSSDTIQAAPAIPNPRPSCAHNAPWRKTCFSFRLERHGKRGQYCRGPV